MSTSVWTMVVGGVAGLALAAYGAWILIARRAPAVTSRSFRCLRDAGFYHLLFGLALALVVVGTGLDRGLLTGVSTVLAIGMACVAIVRFRPRGGGRHPTGSR